MQIQILPRCKIGKQLCTVDVPVHGMNNASISLIKLISDGIYEEIIACAFLSQTSLSSSERKRVSSCKKKRFWNYMSGDIGIIYLKKEPANNYILVIYIYSIYNYIYIDGNA